MVLACEAELIDELLCFLTDATGGLHGEGNEVSDLRGGHLLVRVMLASGGSFGDCEGLGAGCGNIGRGKRVRNDDVIRMCAPGRMIWRSGLFPSSELRPWGSLQAAAPEWSE